MLGAGGLPRYFSGFPWQREGSEQLTGTVSERRFDVQENAVAGEGLCPPLHGRTLISLFLCMVLKNFGVLSNTCTFIFMKS